MAWQNPSPAAAAATTPLPAVGTEAHESIPSCRTIRSICERTGRNLCKGTCELKQASSTRWWSIHSSLVGAQSVLCADRQSEWSHMPQREIIDKVDAKRFKNRREGAVRRGRSRRATAERGKPSRQSDADHFGRLTATTTQRSNTTEIRARRADYNQTPFLCATLSATLCNPIGGSYVIRKSCAQTCVHA